MSKDSVKVKIAALEVLHKLGADELAKEKVSITFLVELYAQMNLLAYGFPMAVVKDRNGVLHAIGIDDGIDFTVAQSTGGAKTELNGYTLTGVSTTGSLSPKLDASTVTAFLALV